MGASTLVQQVCSKDHMNPSSAMTATTSLQQSWEIPELPANSSFATTGVASRDVVVNEGNGVWVRLFLPESAQGGGSKLPLLVHVHGGGFVRFSPATASYHDFCEKVALDARVLVVSLNHRLSPAYRLPAAFHDLAEALQWLRTQAHSLQDDSDTSKTATCSPDPWLATYADFSKVIFMGGSSGGNIVHNTLLELLAGPLRHLSLSPLKLVGQILLQPFFGGADRTNSEVELSDGPIITLSMSDQLWSMALPEGAGREHRFCDPLQVDMPTCLPKALVVVGGRDLLHDRQVAFATSMKTAGVDVKLVDYPEATHGFVTSEGSISYVFMPEVLSFISSCQT